MERGDRLQQGPAVAHQGDTDLAQVLGRQARQDSRVDIVGPEGRLVLLQVKTAQPRREVHHTLHTGVGNKPYHKLLSEALPARCRIEGRDGSCKRSTLTSQTAMCYAAENPAQLQ